MFENVRAKTIEGFDKYFITEKGELYRKKMTGNKRIMPNSVGARKDFAFQYSQNGRKGRSYAHRLVAEAFLPNPDNLDEVDHIDENQQNNTVENLRWVSRQDNMKHYHNMNGRRNYIKKLEAKEKKIRESFRNYEAEVAKLEVHEQAAMKRIDELLCESNDLELMIFEKQQRLKDETARLVSNHAAVYDSVEAMVEAVGVKCKVNGITYPSAGSAARYIEENYPEGTAKRSTISKAIRRMIQGKREPWCMYGQFNIDRVA